MLQSRCWVSKEHMCCAHTPVGLAFSTEVSKGVALFRFFYGFHRLLECRKRRFSISLLQSSLPHPEIAENPLEQWISGVLLLHSLLLEIPRPCPQLLVNFFQLHRELLHLVLALFGRSASHQGTYKPYKLAPDDTFHQHTMVDLKAADINHEVLDPVVVLVKDVKRVCRTRMDGVGEQHQAQTSGLELWVESQDVLLNGSEGSCSLGFAKHISILLFFFRVGQHVFLDASASDMLYAVVEWHLAEDGGSRR
mmetsp:Transcript_17352/g.31133  ORF Transcript_17352/g.31133 Transcript_17352/m.31133 type:complete len:251 (-) Transcript_17352:222-974(-)